MSYLPSPNLQPHQLNGRLPTNHTRSWLTTLVWLGLATMAPLTLQGQCAIAQNASTTASPSSVTQGVETATVLIVNPATGNDTAADGTEKAPFKTITQALQVAQPNTVIQLMPGTYGAETGESFPLKLKPGTIIQGNSLNRGSDVVIRGSGFFLSPTWARQNVTILGANQAALVGVTVTNPEPQGYGVWVESSSPLLADNTFTGSGHDGISVTGNGAPLIRNNFFYANGANGITIYNASRPEVRENIFEQTGFGININQRAMPLIVGNRITLNKDGIVIQAKARPILRNNSIEGNTRDGVVAIAESRPDLGSATEPGGNFIRNNGQFDVNAKATSQRILAFGNELTTTSGQIDLAGTDPETIPVSGSLDALPSGPPVSSSPTQQSLPATLPTVPVTASTSTTAATVPPRSSLDFNKPLRSSSPPASSPKAVVTTIPFGERLSAVPPAGGAMDKFPTVEIGETTSVPFPVPTALSGKPVPQASPRPIRIVSLVEGEGRKTELPPVPATGENNSVAVSRPSSKPFPVQGGSPEFPKPVAQSAPVPIRTAAMPESSLKPVRYQLPVLVTQPVKVAVPSSNVPASKQPSAPTVIPVPLPERSVAVVPSPASLQKPLPLPVSVPSVVPKAVEIPVPVPESPAIAPAVVSRPPQAKVAVNQTPSGTNSSLLPVPDSNIPLGNAGSGSGVRVYGASVPQDSSNPPAPPLSSASLGVRYRVIVETTGSSEEAQVKALVPAAFLTSSQGRTVMQVGAFGDRIRADDLVQTLTSQGLRATIEPID